MHLSAQEDKVNVAEILEQHGAEIDPQTKACIQQEILRPIIQFLCGRSNRPNYGSCQSVCQSGRLSGTGFYELKNNKAYKKQYNQYSNF